MKRILPLLMVIIALALAVLGRRASSAQDKQDKYTLKVPGGLAFSDFKGYEDWQAVGPSQTDAAKRDQTHPCESRDDRRIQGKVFPAMASPSPTAPRLRRLSGDRKS